MLKIAGMEETEVTDPKTGLTINVSTTARLIFRKMFPTEYGALRNARLNAIIAEDFAKSSNNAVHYFRLGKEKDQGVAEIRSASISGVFYISAIRENSIDIITIQSDWLRPKYKVMAPDESGMVE